MNGEQNQHPLATLDSLEPGVFPSAPDPVDADVCHGAPLHLYVEHPGSTGFPMAPPLYFAVQVNDTGASASQFAWNGESAWTRSGGMEQSVTPGTDVLQVTGLPQGGAAVTGAFIVMSSGTALSGMFYPGAFTPSAAGAAKLSGVLAFQAAGFVDGSVLINGQTVAEVVGGAATLVPGDLNTPKGTLRLDGVQAFPDRLEFTLSYEWTDLAAPVFLWNDWTALGCACTPKPDVYVTVSGIDANDCVIEAAKLYVTGSGVNFPVGAPLYFEVKVDDGGASASQFAWTLGGDTKYMRTWQAAAGTFSAWKPYYGRTDYVPLAGGASVSNYESRPVQTGLDRLTLNASSFNTVTLTVEGVLEIVAEPLGRNVNKTILLNLEAETATDLVWPEHLIWHNEGEAPQSMPRGRMISVEIRFANGLVSGHVITTYQKELPPEPGNSIYVFGGVNKLAYGDTLPPVNEVTLADTIQRIVYRESDGLIVATGGTGALYHGQKLGSLTRTLGAKQAQRISCRQSDGMLLATGNNGVVGYGADPMSLVWYTKGSGISGWSKCRESDGMFVGAMDTTCGILYGTNPANLALKTYTKGAYQHITCRHSDGMFFLTGTSHVLYGTNPGNFSYKDYGADVGSSRVVCRQSDGMFVFVGGSVANGQRPYRIYYGYDPAQLSRATADYGNITPLFVACRESDGLLIIGGVSGRRILYGTDPENLRTAEIDISVLGNIWVNQENGMIIFGGYDDGPAHAKLGCTADPSTGIEVQPFFGNQFAEFCSLPLSAM